MGREENTLFMLSQIAFSVQMSGNQVNQVTVNLTSGTQTGKQKPKLSQNNWNYNELKYLHSKIRFQGGSQDGGGIGREITFSSTNSSKEQQNGEQSLQNNF